MEDNFIRYPCAFIIDVATSYAQKKTSGFSVWVSQTQPVRLDMETDL